MCKMTKKLIKELMEYPLTDFGNALRLQALFGKRWVYLPRYRSWMYRDLHSWKGKCTKDICYATSAAFRHLAQDIYQMPLPKEEWERERRTDAICWLILSQRTTNVRNAVKLYRDMQLEEELISEEVLKEN